MMLTLVHLTPLSLPWQRIATIPAGHADEVAGWLGTIAYDVVATILPRVPREAET